MVSRSPLLVAAVVLMSCGIFVTGAGRLAGAVQKFYPDDPIAREPETADASGAEPWDIDLVVDLLLNLFTRPGDPDLDRRAGNLNTIDEVPDSNWFTNRIFARPLSVEEAARGPLTSDGPAPGTWTIVAPKETGFAPGFRMRDSRGDIWFVSFDARGYPEAATGAILVANKIFWTLGYWQAENYLIAVQPDQLVIADSTMIRNRSGSRRRMLPGDLDEVFRRSHQSADGTYRAVAAKGLPGRILGGFRYYGTRPDDPNDLVPHEHRRELRALKVFGAWTNLVDMKAGNTLDSVITENGRGIIRHYLQDVGSTFGAAANAPREYDEGWEYLYEGHLALRRFATLGFFVQPWQTVPYIEHDAIGRFEGVEFDPVQWKPRVPTAAFLRARPDDTFWAARRVMAFPDDMIRGIVRTGGYTDPAAETLLGNVLIERRDKIGAAYLPAVNPLVNFSLTPDGALTFENAAVEARVASPASRYQAVWERFDNHTGSASGIGPSTFSDTTVIRAPAALPTVRGEFLRIQVRAAETAPRSWTVPVTTYFRREPSGWELVGLERLP
jgi:hypothetical protein